MRISVITAAWNLIEAGREATFRQTVESVRAQVGADVEHVVIDGGSTDGTAAWARGMAEAGEIAVFHSEPDRGVYEAMNRGAARATGDYLLFLNSDDFLHRNDGLADLAGQAASGPDFLAAPVLCLGEDGRPRVAGVSRFYARVLVTMPFCHQGLAMRRDLFQRLGGFDLGYRIVADYDLVLRMFLAGATGRRLSRPIATFRPGGLSSDRDALAEEHLAVWKARLPGVEEVDDRDWDAAAARRTLPRPVLRAIAGSREYPTRLRWIARWHLLKRA